MLHPGLIPAHAGKTSLAHPARVRYTAHPRSRGENWLAGESWALEAGSSPLTRGKHESGDHEGPDARLIPAHAGKTRHEALEVLNPRAHPRSRGENLRLYGLGAMNEGSSPLTRGKLHESFALGFGHRLIPAHAGKTSVAALVMPSREAHPRSRGENTVDLHDLCPFMWLIPAHAGKTQSRGNGRMIRRAHPRSRGEN